MGWKLKLVLLVKLNENVAQCYKDGWIKVEPCFAGLNIYKNTMAQCNIKINIV